MSIEGNEGISTDPKPTFEVEGHPWFAATYDLLCQEAEQRVPGRIRQQLAGAFTGRILEIGAGTGANFPYYATEAQTTATDPDPFMLPSAQKRAAVIGRAIALCRCPAEALPFADASFDTVVYTLVLCTVTDPMRSLAEIKRVLKPGGILRFIEYVRSENVVAGQVQDVLTPIWRRFGPGCHLNRRIAANVEALGLDIVTLHQGQLYLQQLIRGEAVRAENGAKGVAGEPERAKWRR